MVDLKQLIKNGVHFGHQTAKWSPKMGPYIWGSKNNIHLINVAKTAFQLERASEFLKCIVSEGKTVVWVGTKKAAQEAIEKAGRELNLPFVVHRWVGGTFSNYRQVRKSVANLMHFEDVLTKSEDLNYNKKELNVIQKKIDRLEKNVGGIRQLTWPIGAVIVVDVKKEHVCVKEAIATGIPIVALVDTNSDPSLIDYVIPANDDAPRAVSVVVDYLIEAVKKGQEILASKPKEEVAVLSEEFEVKDRAHNLLEDEEEDKSKSKGRRPAPSRQPRRPQAGQANKSRPRAPRDNKS